MKKVLLIGLGLIICSISLQGTILPSNTAYAEVKQLSQK